MKVGKIIRDLRLAKNMRERAREETKKILEEHNPQYVSEDVKKEIDRVAQAAQRKVLERISKTRRMK